tara:strand:+ start:55 stop:846 length:792 start_codon:yes stop_codon:yes gene_type:complete
MKKYIVIGNPIEHSLSPKIHNFWLKKNKILAEYGKKKLTDVELKDFVLGVKKKEIDGANVTVPFKQKIIPLLDRLSLEAEQTQSVNTLYLNNNEIIGHNTDIMGFERGIKDTKFEISNKKIFILGAGGVVPSIIFSLNKMKALKISVSNRTQDKVLNLKNLFKNIVIVDWGVVPEFDMVINATSVGLKDDQKLDLDFSKIGKGKFFYDVIYNPKETNFLKIGKKLGNQTENGKKMFIYQAAEAFKIWHNVQPEINNEVIKLIE